MSAAALCLALLVYAEARGENPLDHHAVAYVALNRAKEANQPLCRIIRKKGQFAKMPVNPQEKEAWIASKAAAQAVLTRRVKDPTFGATFFHHVRERPKWSRFLTVTLRTEKHVYYRKESSHED